MADNSTYRGPGKLLTAWGGWAMGGFIGGLVATGLTLVFPPMGLAAGLLLGLGGSVAGAFIGYKQAEKGRQQFEQLQQTAAAPSAPYAGISVDAQQPSQQRFTDRIKSRTQNGSFQDAVLNERSQSSELQR